MKAFDYKEAVARLEKIAEKVEDPSTGIDDIDKYVKESNEIIASCRAYLRTVREKLSELD